jgi:2-octaprenyl-6-methoxyphenol hydroxylase
MPDQIFDVVVYGDSLAGQALALALHRSLGGELTVAIAKRQRTQPTSPDPRAFALSAATVKALTALGVWPALAADAQPVASIAVGGGRLDSPVRQSLLNYDNLTTDGDPASHIVPADRVRAALTQAVADNGLRVLEGGRTLSVSAQDALVRMERAAADPMSATLAVAADGYSGALREFAGIKTMGWTYPQTAIVTTVAHSEPHHGIARQHFLEAGPFAILPLTGGHRSSLVWTERSDEVVRVMALPDPDFMAALEQRFGGILGTLTLDGPRACHTLELRLARGLVGDRIALIGDAARTVHPLAGQGFNLALRDVAALTECIADTARLGLDIGGPETLRRYEQWRRFDSTASAAAFDGLNRLFSNDNPALRVLRETGLGLTDRLPGLKRMLVDEAAGLTGTLPKLLQGELP